MMKFGLVLFAVLALSQSRRLNARDSIQVQLYYQSFCPGSVQLISESLHETYQALGSSMIKLEMIPVASEVVLANGTKQFICVHGEQECYGNKVHSCALGLYPIEIAESFIHCLEKTGGSADTTLIKQCAKDVKISYDDIEDCMSNGLGDELFSANIKKAHAATFLKIVPTIVFDGKYNREDSFSATSDFRGVVCEKLGHPEGCDKKYITMLD